MYELIYPTWVLVFDIAYYLSRSFRVAYYLMKPLIPVGLFFIVREFDGYVSNGIAFVVIHAIVDHAIYLLMATKFKPYLSVWFIFPLAWSIEAGVVGLIYVVIIVIFTVILLTLFKICGLCCPDDDDYSGGGGGTTVIIVIGILEK